MCDDYIKLNKEVCKKCFKEFEFIWRSTDEKEWNTRRVIFCPNELDEDSGRDYPLSIEGIPPEFCPYKQGHYKKK